MYFWKVDDLIADFIADKVTAKEEMKYIICYIIFSYSAALVELALPLKSNLFDYAGLFSSLFLYIIGVYACYRINSTGDDKDFLRRMVCISVPVGIRTMVIFAPIMLLCFFLLMWLNDTKELWSFVLRIVWVIIFLCYLCKKIKDVSE
jgi:L-asparagine transporter-like permease